MYPCVGAPYYGVGSGAFSAGELAPRMQRRQELQGGFTQFQHGGEYPRHQADQQQCLFDPLQYQQPVMLQHQLRACQDQMQMLLEHQHLIDSHIRHSQDQMFSQQMFHREQQKQGMLAENDLLSKMRQQHARFTQANSHPSLPSETNLLARMRQQHSPGNIAGVAARAVPVPHQTRTPAMKTQDIEQTLQIQAHTARLREEQEALQRGWADLHAQRDMLCTQQAEIEAAKVRMQAQNQELASKTAADTRGLAEAQALAVVPDAPPGKRISLTEDGPWLAQQCSSLSVQGLTGDTGTPAKVAKPAVFLDLGTFWPPLWTELPEPKFGVGPLTFHFGLLFGSRVRGGILQLDAAELCPNVFTWEASLGSADEWSGDAAEILEEQLHRDLESYLSTVFVPWTSSREVGFGKPRAAWLILTDGEAFALPSALLAFGRSSGKAAERWRETAVVADRSKSSAEDAAVEVMALQGPEAKRMLFEVI